MSSTDAIGYYTDNNVSHTVMKHFSRGGFPVKHIRQFDNTKPGIFYGMLRGNGPAMRILADRGIDYWYVDNGYFDAQYMDLEKHKNMTGKYRIVKNQMIEPYPEGPCATHNGTLRVLILPPSPYSAFMHDTTPEDWLVEWKGKCEVMGYSYVIRDKSEQKRLTKHLSDFDCLLTFNSMGAVAAISEGKAVYTTHGIIRNDHLFGKFAPFYDMAALKAFYEPKQFTLEEIKERGQACLT